MTGLETIFWRGKIDWKEIIALADAVLQRWNTVTPFISKTDMRERMWTARHSSMLQPFLIITQDAMHGSAPRIGNPMAALLLMGIALSREGAIELTFANGQKIDPAKFELADLTTLLPHATHAAHRKLAALALSPPAPPEVTAETPGV